MRIGTPTEVEEDEGRVAVTATGTRELTDAGHQVFVQSGAGLASGIGDDDYAQQGAVILPDGESVFAEAELVLKVKDPQPEETEMLRSDHVLFAYLHLSANPELASALMRSGATCIAYETVEDNRGRLPLLAPMSEVAGKLAVQAGAFMLERPRGGRGILLGGAPGVPPAHVIVLGGGVVGTNAAVIASGMGAETWIFDTRVDRLRALEGELPTTTTRFSSALAIEEALPRADLVIGAVLVHGARAPRLVNREMLALLPRRAVLVDVAIDQGGCFETSRPTTHSHPTFERDGVLHYCVANIPGAVPVTATFALTNATLPYVMRIAELGVREASRRDPGLELGVNVAGGRLANRSVAESVGLAYRSAGDALAAVALAA
jgi:alanine dehydrogenase